ncbi:hypothetical protein T02_8484 [Trichinella nativa]|uniref:Uncharacterized protein n=1 Tax=Trichinella nativa TaxID=6335 RepID=A0A0V1LPA0_9BILA|nr:hypothetical protein T02_8484 [Trichinella nativa]
MKEWKTMARLLLVSTPTDGFYACRSGVANCTAPSTVGKEKGHLPATRCQRLTCQAPLVDPRRRQLAIPYKPTSRKTIQSARMNGKGRRGRAPVDGRPGRWTSAPFGHHGRSAYRISNNASCPVLIWLDNPTAKSDAIQSTTVDRSDQGQLALGATLTMGVVRLDGKFALDGAILENSVILLTLSAPANAVFLPCAEGRLFASHLYAG